MLTPANELQHGNCRRNDSRQRQSYGESAAACRTISSALLRRMLECRRPLTAAQQGGACRSAEGAASRRRSRRKRSTSCVSCRSRSEVLGQEPRTAARSSSRCCGTRPPAHRFGSSAAPQHRAPQRRSTAAPQLRCTAPQHRSIAAMRRLLCLGSEIVSAPSCSASHQKRVRRGAWGMRRGAWGEVVAPTDRGGFR
jgi:hypothetical protein